MFTAERILFLSLMAGQSLWIVLLQFKLRKSIEFGLMMRERCKTLTNIILRREETEKRESMRPSYNDDEPIMSTQ
jgi:hypothetical protein